MRLPPIYAINLDRDAQRWQRLKQATRAAGLTEVERFPAINVRELKPTELRACTTWLGRQLQPPGVLGCALSHMALWRRMVAEDIPVAIILEDDVELVPGFREKLEKNLQQLGEIYPNIQLHSVNSPPLSISDTIQPQGSAQSGLDSFDVILLGGMGRVHPEGLDSAAARFFSLCAGGCQAPLRKNSLLHRPMRPAGTHAYLLTKRGAEKLLQACPKARYHIDIDAWGQASVDVLMFDPMLAYQSFDSSTLLETSPAGGGGDSTNSRGLLRHLLSQAAQVSPLLPAWARDPHTRQPWRHALAEPLLQLGSRGPVLRNAQVLALSGGGLLLAAASALMGQRRAGGALLWGTASFVVLVKLLVELLLRSTE